MLVNVPAFAIVMLITWLLLRGARESVAREQHHGRHQARSRWRSSSASGVMHIDPANYVPFAPNGWRGIHQGAAIVFFAYIGFDAISTAAEETKNPQRNLPIGILGGLAICTVIYVDRRRRADRPGAVPAAGESADPLAHALQLAGFADGRAGSSRSAPSSR